ncbi:MAG: NADH-quinone oxidoreductase subunit N [Methylotetracoccus sp.]
MTITSEQLLALSPLLVLASGAAALMLCIAYRRQHDLVFAVTALTLIATIAALLPASRAASPEVSSLLLLDRYALFFIGLACLAGLATMLPCRAYLAARSSEPEEFYILLLTTTLGAGVLAASRHFAGLFLGLEILSVSLFPMIAYPRRDNRALEAGMKYLVLSGVSSAFLLFGIALIYAATGVLDFARITPPATPDPALLAGVVMVVAALGFKLSLAPFHLWTADVYEGAPAPVGALLATLSKGAVFALLFRYGLDTAMPWQPRLLDVLMLLAGLSILVGNLSALRQSNLKRLLAYSSIAHMGYLMIAPIALGRVDATLAAESMCFYLAAYYATTLAAFGVITVLSTGRSDVDELHEYTGLFWTRPWLAGLMTIALLSLAGIPLTAGFVAKFYLFTTGAQGAFWVLLSLMIVGSGLGLYYYVRVIYEMIQPATSEPGTTTVAWGARLSLGVLGLLVLVIGVAPATLINFLRPLSQPVHIEEADR